MLTAISGGSARAQPPPAEPSAAAAPSQNPDDDKDTEGRAHYDNGRKLLAEGAYGPALAEFLEARRVWPDRWPPASAAAVCLRKLERFDEALDIMVALLREHGDRLPPDTKTAVQKEVVDLKARVGAIEITKAEPGASLFIDGQSRGEYPPTAPLRVIAGSHMLRVYKEGFLPFETHVEVAGGHSPVVAVSMTKLVRAGLLRVEEKKGRSLDVVVDGLIVGKTPWEGPIAVGGHSVMLHGPNELGTVPRSVSIQEKARAAITLEAEPLAASITVKPSPVEASVAVDGIFVSRGGWQGRLRSGSHVMTIVADGYFPEERKIALDRGESHVMKVDLRRDPKAVRWRAPGRFNLELTAGYAAPLSIGGDIANSCVSPCEKGLGVGGQLVVHGGYEIWNGFGFGLSVGYLRVDQTLTDRSLSLKPVGFPEVTGKGEDTLKVRGFRGSVWASYRIGDGDLRGRLRLGAGVLYGTTTDIRTGEFQAGNKTTYQLGPAIVSPSTLWFHVAPEAKLAWRFLKSWELAAGMEGMVLIAPSPPQWSADTQIFSAETGNASFPTETLAGGVMLALVPGLSVRHDF